MRTIPALICGLTIATSASAQQFSIGAIDASNGAVQNGAPGTHIDIVGGTIYQDGFGTAGATGEPNQSFLAVWPSLPYDTYLTIDREPISNAPGYDGTDVAAAAEAPGSAGFTSNSYRGAWFVSGPFVNSFNVQQDGDWIHQIFLGRITHTGTLDARLRTTFAEPGDANFSLIEGDVVTETQFAQGLGWITQDITGRTLGAVANGFAYAFIKKEFQQDIDGTMYTVSDMYIQSLPIPGPGAVGFVLIGSVWGSRRRQRNPLACAWG